MSVAQLSGIVPGPVMLADAELCMASTRIALGGCSFLFPLRSTAQLLSLPQHGSGLLSRHLSNMHQPSPRTVFNEPM